MAGETQGPSGGEPVITWLGFESWYIQDSTYPGRRVVLEQMPGRPRVFYAIRLDIDDTWRTLECDWLDAVAECLGMLRLLPNYRSAIYRAKMKV